MQDQKPPKAPKTRRAKPADAPVRAVGRPPLIITDEIIKQAEVLAARGLNKKQIADALGIGYSTLMDKKLEFPEFEAALKRGIAKGIATVAGKLMTKIDALDTASILFYLKCQAGWREQPTQLELTGADGGPVRTFAMDFGLGGPGSAVEVIGEDGTVQQE